MNKTIKLVLVLTVIAIVAYGVWWYTSEVRDQSEERQEEVTELTDDSTESINVALEAIVVGDVDSEFNEIDEFAGQL